jgi:hypothetical protein
LSRSETAVMVASLHGGGVSTQLSHSFVVKFTPGYDSPLPSCSRAMQKGRLKSPRTDASADVNTFPQHPTNLKSLWCSSSTCPKTHFDEPVDGVVDFVGGASVDTVDGQSPASHARSTKTTPS